MMRRGITFGILLGLFSGLAQMSPASSEPSWAERARTARYKTLTWPDSAFSERENRLTVRAVARAFGVSEARMVCIVEHESGWNERAQNPTSSAAGLFQFVAGTWSSASGAYRAPDPLRIRSNPSALNARANALVAGKLLQMGQWFHWEGSGC